MLNDTTDFVMKPIFGDLQSQGLKLRDIIIYIAIRELCNIEDDGCSPSLNEIKNLSECSKKGIRKSIKRLQKANFLKFDEWSAKNAYAFNHDFRFQKIPSDILFEEALSIEEKAILLIVNEYNLEGCAGIGIEIAESSGLYIKEFRRHYQSLLEKGYLIEDISFCDIDNRDQPFIWIPEEGLDFGLGKVYIGSELEMASNDSQLQA